jgi:hypothetical protein
MREKYRPQRDRKRSVTHFLDACKLLGEYMPWKKCEPQLEDMSPDVDEESGL